MNFHTDEWIMNKLNEHFSESKEHFSDKNIVCICLQGSQNYGLDIETSDVDSKLIVTPSLDNIAFAKKPISTTHIRANEEHIDFKDIRLYIETFHKQNLNFIEILFTPYYWVNPIYKDQWDRLVKNNELIARYNIPQAIKSMQGIAKEKYFAMEHHYPSKEAILQKYGYDCKQLHHLLRIKDFLTRYIDGEPYASCMYPEDEGYLIEVKKNFYTLDEARSVASKTIAEIDEIVKKVMEKFPRVLDTEIDDLLNDVQYQIIKKSIILELGDK